MEVKVSQQGNEPDAGWIAAEDLYCVAHQTGFSDFRNLISVHGAAAQLSFNFHTGGL
jgi:hypothetical protein